MPDHLFKHCSIPAGTYFDIKPLVACTYVQEKQTLTGDSRFFLYPWYFYIES